MNDFVLWFSTGVEHIADLSAYDHILFVTLLVMAFPLTEWRKLLWLVTAFTVGHSLSLALSVVENLNLNSFIIEFGIALSILMTALTQFVLQVKSKKPNEPFFYGTIIFFGLIHGMGFSFLLKAMLGKEDSVILPLVYFNLGLELGQLIIVGIVLVFSLFLTLFLKWSYKIYKTVVISLIAIIALQLCAERLFQLLS